MTPTTTAGSPMQAKAAFVPLDIAVGDTLLAGRFKNVPITVKEIGTDELGQPTINGRKLLTVRIKKTMPKTASHTSLLAAVRNRLLSMSPEGRALVTSGVSGLIGEGIGRTVFNKPWLGGIYGLAMGPSVYAAEKMDKYMDKYLREKQAPVETMPHPSNAPRPAPVKPVFRSDTPAEKPIPIPTSPLKKASIIGSDIMIPPTERFLVSVLARPERRAAALGLLGAAGGGLIGSAVDKPWQGAAIGGAGGAGLGAAFPLFLTGQSREKFREVEIADAVLRALNL